MKDKQDTDGEVKTKEVSLMESYVWTHLYSSTSKDLHGTEDMIVWRHKDLLIDNVPLLRDNARLHTRNKIRETIVWFGLTTLPHPPYSTDLLPSDYHLFGPKKDCLRGKHYASDKEMKSAVMRLLKEQSTMIDTLIQR